MSTIESILDNIKKRCNVLREHIDRGRYDGERDDFQEKLEQFLAEGGEYIHKFYKKKYGMKYRFKNKKAEDNDKQRLFQIVKEHGDDLTNRLNLVNYYIHNSLNDPNECRDMSEEKCTRAENLSHCHWVPGGEKFGQWMMRKAWTARTNNNNKPEYVGSASNQKPRGCYPVSDADKTGQTRELTKKELNILRYKQESERKQKTEAEKAEARIPKKQLTDKDREKIRKRRQEMLNRLERLKAMKASKKNNAGERKINGGKRRRKTRRKKKKAKKTRKKRGGRRKRMTAKEYWKSGRFLGKTWWMPRSMKTASWFHDTLKYGIPI